MTNNQRLRQFGILVNPHYKPNLLERIFIAVFYRPKVNAVKWGRS